MNKATIYSVILFILITSAFSQQDSITGKNGVSVFCGIGLGNNGIKQGFARGFDARTHFSNHTISGYLSKTTKYEANYTTGNDLTLTYDAFNCGLMYGYGIYESHFSAVALFGIGHTDADVIVRNPDPSIYPYAIFLHKKYIRTCGVLGFQAGVRSRFLGIGLRGYYNIFDGPSNFVLLAGLEITFK